MASASHKQHLKNSMCTDLWLCVLFFLLGISWPGMAQSCEVDLGTINRVALMAVDMECRHPKLYSRLDMVFYAENRSDMQKCYRIYAYQSDKEKWHWTAWNTIAPHESSYDPGVTHLNYRGALKLKWGFFDLQRDEVVYAMMALEPPPEGGCDAYNKLIYYDSDKNAWIAKEELAAVLGVSKLEPSALKKILKDEPAWHQIADAMIRGVPSREGVAKKSDWILLSPDNQLKEAVAVGNQEAVWYALDRGADINVADEKGWTPLMHAAVDGRFAVVKVLLARGADRNRVSNNGETAIALARKKDNTGIVKLLETATGKPPPTMQGSTVDTTQPMGGAPRARDAGLRLEITPPNKGGALEFGINSKWGFSFSPPLVAGEQVEVYVDDERVATLVVEKGSFTAVGMGLSLPNDPIVRAVRTGSDGHEWEARASQRVLVGFPPAVAPIDNFDALQFKKRFESGKEFRLLARFAEIEKHLFFSGSFAVRSVDAGIFIRGSSRFGSPLFVRLNGNYENEPEIVKTGKPDLPEN